MCFIIGGKNSFEARISDTWPPWLTCLAISAQASSIWTLPLAAAVISRVLRIGTPERMSVAYVLQKRESAILWTRLPKIGAFTRARSLTRRPFGVATNFDKAQ